MKQVFNEIELVKRFQDIEGEASDKAHTKARASLMAEIAKAEAPKRKRSRRRLLAGVLVPAAVLGLAGGAYQVLKPVSHGLATIVCTAEPNVEDTSVLSGGPSDGRLPEQICADEWRQGNMEMFPEASRIRNLPPEKGGGSKNAVPPLTTCAATEGDVIYVVPSADKDVCERQGLADYKPPEDYKEQVGRFNRLEEELNSRFEGKGPCLDKEGAIKAGREVLDKHGFTQWKVEADEDFNYWGFVRPCAIPILDSHHDKTLLLVPMDPFPEVQTVPASAGDEAQGYAKAAAEVYEKTRSEGQCLSVEQALSVTREALDKYGFSDWNVDMGGDSERNVYECAQPEFGNGDIKNKLIDMQFFPRNTDGGP